MKGERSWPTSCFQRVHNQHKHIAVTFVGFLLFCCFILCVGTVMASTEHLQKRVAELEAELALLKEGGGAGEKGHVRGKIQQMSAEVVDSNPYRLAMG